MKKQISQLLLVAALFTYVASYAQTNTEGTESINFLSLSLDYAKFVFLGMLITAANHIVAGTFNGSLWLKDTFLPGVLTFAGGLAIAAADIYLAKWDFFVEAIVGGPTDYLDFTNLAVTGMVLVSLIKGIFKINKTREKNAKRKAALNS